VLRTFVAIELPSVLLGEIGSLLERMRGETPGGKLRFPPPENIHLTLKFLGPTPETQVAAILAALESALSRSITFELTPRGIGAFPPQGAPHVVWLGLEGDLARLNETAESVETALHPLGFPREGRPFSPHLTIARAPRNAPGKAAGEALKTLARLDVPLFSGFRVETVTLMESRLGGPHSVYAPLGRLPLAEK
jgi:RNA 2',3'-cyclic 3'-phosphodiesterase